MATTSDQQVSAQDVLAALMRLRRQGSGPVMEHLEKVEPDLAGYLMEELSLVHRDLLALGGPPKRTQRLQRRVEGLALACVTALREAHYRLWRQSDAGTSLVAELDPASAPERPAEGGGEPDQDGGPAPGQAQDHDGPPGGHG